LTIWVLTKYPDLCQLGGLASVVAAAFTVSLGLGLLVLGLFLGVIGWAGDKGDAE
jgi:hypothetical protein